MDTTNFDLARSDSGVGSMTPLAVIIFNVTVLQDGEPFGEDPWFGIRTAPTYQLERQVPRRGRQCRASIPTNPELPRMRFGIE